MPDISAYASRSPVLGTDRLFIASAESDVIQVATAGQIAALSDGAAYLGPILGLGAPLVRPALASMTQVVQSGASAGAYTLTETTPGPITLNSQNGGYNITALCIAPPVSGNWSYDMLIEALPFGSGPGLYLEDAAGKGFIAYFYQGNQWLGQYTTARNDFAANEVSYSQVITPQTLWYRVSWDSVAQAFSIFASANRISWQHFGPPQPVSAGFMGVPVLVGMGCINIGAFGAQMDLWHLAPSPSS